MSLTLALEDLSERALLAERVRKVAAAPAGRLLVRGEPGLGKTTLLGEALRNLHRDGVRLLHTRASDWSPRLPYAGLIDLFSGVSPNEFDVLATAQRDAVDIAISRKLATHAVLPLTLRVAVTTVIENLLAQGPLAVVVDDWSLLDEETKDILTWVFTRPGAASRAALVATERASGGFFHFANGEVGPRLFDPQDVCDLPPLDPRECESLLRESFGDRLSHVDLVSIVHLARGNPLWAMEIAHGRSTADQASNYPRDLPGSIAEILMARVSTLPAAVADVLATVSALGEASTSQVLLTMDAPPDAYVDALEAGVIIEGHGRVRLAHPLLGKASMASIGREHHRQIHARAAESATNLVERASHLDKAAAPGFDSHVAGALQDAAAEARLKGALITAAGLAERALDRTREEDPRLVDRLLLVAETAFARGEFLRTTEVLAGVEWAALSPDLLDKILPLMVDATAAEHGEEEVAALLANLGSLLGTKQPQSAIVQGLAAELESVPPARRKDHAERALEVLTTRTDVPVTTHRALGALVLTKLDTGEGLDTALLDRITAIEPSIEFIAMQETGLAQRGFYSHQVDDHAASAVALEQLIATAESRGEELMAGFFSLHLAAVAIEVGDVSRGRTLLGRFDTVDPWIDAPPPSVVRTKGLLAIADGDQTELNSILASTHGPGTARVDQGVRWALEGIFAARSEKWATAVPLLQAAVDLANEAGVVDPGRRLWADMELGEALVALGRTEEAKAIADSLSCFADLPTRPLSHARYLRLRGLVQAADNDLARAEDSFRAALELLRDGPRAIERARVLFELGRLLRRRRARARARETFDQALGLSKAAADQLLSARVTRERDRVAGTALSGDLTASEVRVASEVLAGASNGDVAAALFVSIRTVEAHLSAIYRKWGLRSRIQLVAELHKRAELSPLART
jgi:DNA-binding CsgD family transcriptional regulator